MWTRRVDWRYREHDQDLKSRINATTYFPLSLFSPLFKYCNKWRPNSYASTLSSETSLSTSTSMLDASKRWCCLMLNSAASFWVGDKRERRKCAHVEESDCARMEVECRHCFERLVSNELHRHLWTVLRSIVKGVWEAYRRQGSLLVAWDS